MYVWCMYLIGEGGGDERGPSEGKFLEGGQTHTADDGDQGSVHHRVVDVLYSG